MIGSTCSTLSWTGLCMNSETMFSDVTLYEYRFVIPWSRRDKNVYMPAPVNPHPNETD